MLLAEVDRWAFPETEWERTTVKQIACLRAITVHRVDAAQLKKMRMKPRECHSNSRFMEENDPEGRTKRIVGWWRQRDKYVLHSIVMHRGQYLCVTPVDDNLVPESQFEFFPDSEIEIREERGRHAYYRDGVKIGVGVRTDPSQTIATAKIVRERLLSGMDPYEAVRLS